MTIAQSNDDKILDAIFNPDHEYAIDVTEEEEEQHSSPFPFADPETLAKLKDLEKQAVIAAEAKEFTAAIEILSTIINESPFYASAYNNRAQVYRMQGGMEKALEDLEMAILYGTGNGSILKQAYTQRAVIKKKLGDDLGAEEDFAKGAQLGNALAKMAVKQNPVAKLCNAMVTQLMSQYRTPPLCPSTKAEDPSL